MDIRSIHSKAPTRIDLAGGTVDLWPLYLFLKDPLTLNMGIDLFAEADLEILPSSTPGKSQFILKSEDQKTELALPWEALQQPPDKIPPGLILHFKLLKFFSEKRAEQGGKPSLGDLVLKTRARSPAGAGLGGSSTLSIAMIGALASWASQGKSSIDPDKEGEKFIEVVRDVETTVIQVPAGLQDYYGAMYGGLQCLHWGAGSHTRERLPEELIPELEKRLLLFYSGQSRNSGINNWALFKGFIDREGVNTLEHPEDIRTRFQKITDATQSLSRALKARDWNAVGEAIATEWATRKTLAAGITTPEIDTAFREARKVAPVSGKVCGAGGGGCFFVYLPDGNQETKSRIQKIFAEQGMRALDFRGVPHGLEVRVTRG